MNSQEGIKLRPRRRHLTAILAAMLLASAAAVGVVPGGARTSQGEASEPREREFKDTVPAHVPIKVKVKDERRFKDLKNKDWARELEIEVKNTGNKPIYSLYVVVLMRDLLVQGHPLVLGAVYGRKDLAFLDNPVRPDDVPIRPGESVTLKVPQNQLSAYERMRDAEKRAEPKKVEFEVQLINFGDGTGFHGREATPEAVPIKKQAQNFPSYKDGGRCPPLAGFRKPTYSVGPLNTFFSMSPANILRVNFFTAPADEASGTAAQISGGCNDCRNSNDCMWGVRGFPSCPCDDVSPFLAVLPGGSCGNISGRCLRVETVIRPCDTQYNGQQFCQFQDEIGPCAIADPQPTPTPEPSPEPSPEPTPIDCPQPAPAECCSCREPVIILERPVRMFWSCLLCEAGLPLANGCVASGPSGGCPEGYVSAGPDTHMCCPQAAGGGGTGDCTQAQTERACAADLTVDMCWNSAVCGSPSPVLVDVEGDGFALTSARDGVRFDLDNDGAPEPLSWTEAGSDDSWLALDRDGNGTIDRGAELFGNFTLQLWSPAPNGFLALARFDAPGRGGNSDGVIDARDAVYQGLRLWRDSNHNGLSEPGELRTLPALDVARLHLRHHESKRVDAHGNLFKYRAKVEDARGAKVGRWAWDVFLLRAR